MPHNGDRTLTQFIVTMAILIVISFFNWIKRRSQSEDSSDTSSEHPPPPPGRTLHAPSEQSPSEGRPAPRRIDWEAELRRMLEQRPTTPAPTPTAQPTYSESEHPPITTAPPVLTLPPLSSRPHAPIHPVIIEEERDESGLPVDLPGLTTSTHTYAQASQLDDRVAERLHEISQQVERHRITPHAAVAHVEIERAHALLRNPQSLRSAIIASIILGPPKSLEGC